MANARAGAIPHLVALLSGGGGDGVKERAAGALWSLAINADSKITVDELLDHHIITVYAGIYHSLALSRNGLVLSWARNSHGELGRGEFEYAVHPDIVKGVRHVHTIAAGGRTSCAITTECATFMWGEGYGQDPTHTACGCDAAASVGAMTTVVVGSTGGVIGWRN